MIIPSTVYLGVLQCVRVYYQEPIDVIVEIRKVNYLKTQIENLQTFMDSSRGIRSTELAFACI